MRQKLSALLLTSLLMSLSTTACAAEMTYSDIPNSAWYAEAVAYLTNKGIMDGVGDGRFDPDGTLTRAMSATILYRAEGEPTVNREDSFTDTESGTWYSDGVAWAAQNGLVQGYGKGRFGPTDPVTQEQLAAILWRYAGEPEGIGSAPAGTSVWAVDAVRWAVDSGVLGGSDYNFQPKQPASRAQVAYTIAAYLKAEETNNTPAESNPSSGSSGGGSRGSGSTGTGEQAQPQTPAEASIPQTGWTAAVPAAYKAAATRQGTVERLDYETKDYARDSAPIQKTAYVYLPYGYDPSDTETRYDILYLMHGWGGSAGEYFTMASLKNVFDNLMEQGDMKPAILVSATFYNDNSDRDFSGSIQELRQFHRDFEEALMPAVEGKYHTYAKSTSPEDLKASRDHRAFGGFSLGSVTTWLQFCYDYDYIHWFAPMSGSSWYYGTYGDFQIQRNVDFIEQLVKDNDLDQRGYFIYHAVGTNDAVKSQSIDMAEEMLRRSDVFTPDHYVFYQKDGGYHDFEAVQEYLYNALPLFFREQEETPVQASEPYTTDTPISEVMSDPALGDYGRLLFPVNSGYYSGNTLGDLRLTWYNYIDPDKTVEIANYLKNHAEAGETVFYDIYTDAEKTADPAKANTGLFFFRGKPGAKVAICNAGGGFAYVGAMHDSFPHALELSKQGYNAFALIYRPGWDTAMEDLGRAIGFITDHADELGIDPTGYSLWGGSAGARMAATLGNADDLSQYTGRSDLPQAAAVVMQYTGYNDVSASDAPTYANCGTGDSIASYTGMQNRLNALTSRYGIPTEFHSYPGLSHGYGLGTGTVAEGWIKDAVAFWESNMK